MNQMRSPEARELVQAFNHRSLMQIADHSESIAKTLRQLAWDSPKPAGDPEVRALWEDGNDLHTLARLLRKVEGYNPAVKPEQLGTVGEEESR